MEGEHDHTPAVPHTTTVTAGGQRKKRNPKKERNKGRDRREGESALAGLLQQGSRWER
jgi:hypothetical protein